MNTRTAIPGPAHRCAAPGCREYVRTSLLMCRAHWKRVPRPQQAEVLDAWYEYQQAGTGPAALRRLRDAQAAAVAALEGGAR